MEAFFILKKNLLEVILIISGRFLFFKQKGKRIYGNYKYFSITWNYWFAYYVCQFCTSNSEDV